ncbi:MAG: twin-arginine translocation signal domain-containing protein, partial [Bryobacteraceae bacterium]
MTDLSISRRSLLAMSGAAAGLAAGTFSHPLGAELYTVRDILPAAPEKTLEALASIGYTEVETDRPTMIRHAGLFRRYGLKVAACHVETPLITGNWKPWQVRMAAAKAAYA